MLSTVADPVRSTKADAPIALHALLRRIESEYREMPGLSVTPAQAGRLWGLNGTTCSWVLMTLVQAGILKQTTRGTYIRA